MNEGMWRRQKYYFEQFANYQKIISSLIALNFSDCWFQTTLFRITLSTVALNLLVWISACE